MDKPNIGNTRHGLNKHPLHTIYWNIMGRCYRETNPAYPLYGGSGVIVCEEWRNDFKKFYDWAMANGWEQGLEIDKDIKGGNIYSPENCSIVTTMQNCNARKSNRFLELNGRRMTVSEWGRDIGVDPDTILMRLKNGWSIEKTLTTPVRKWPNQKNKSEWIKILV